MTRAPLLRSSRRDWIATAAITAVCAVAVGGAVVTADIRESTLAQGQLPEKEVRILAAPPNNLTQTFVVPSAPVPGVFGPLISHGLIISNDRHTVRALHPDGTEAWSYGRKSQEICSLGQAWDKVVITYRTGMGCGDVVDINSQTGTYAGTRSAINAPDVVAISSNDRVGTVAPNRLEIWRSDMVRTVEYGQVEAKQEPNMQPHEDCTITSALTRKENLVNTEKCDDASTTWVRVQKATPEDARKPEITADIPIPSPDARLVSIGVDGFAVYVPGSQPKIMSFNNAGDKTHEVEATLSPAIASATTPFAPATADLPHHMTWFDGTRLYLFSPSKQDVSMVVEDVLGTGIAVGDRLLVPVKDGIAVVNWDSGEKERVIPVDRGSFSGPVYLKMAGTTLVEARGDQLVVLTAS